MPTTSLLAAAAVLALVVVLILRYWWLPSRKRVVATAGDDVRFTVYRPGAIAPARWHDLLVFAHRSDLPADSPPSDSSPVERVRQEARRVLGASVRAYTAVSEDSAAPVPSHSQLTFIPDIEGVEFNPPRAMIDWVDDVHSALFQMRAGASLDGTTARGSITVYAGPLLLAEMALVIPVSADAAERVERAGIHESATPYRKVFASYSHRDTDIVQQMEAYSRAFGDQYLRDVTSLRAGEQWEARLLDMIEEADVFQLFWSWNALESEYVGRELSHALSLGRSRFVRPVYWEDPLPAAPDRGLPPPELTSRHFQRLDFRREPAPQKTVSDEQIVASFAFDRLHEGPTPPPTRPASSGPTEIIPQMRVPGADDLPSRPAPTRSRFGLRWLTGAATLMLLATGLVMVGQIGGPAPIQLPPIESPPDPIGGNTTPVPQPKPTTQPAAATTTYLARFQAAPNGEAVRLADALSSGLMRGTPRAGTTQPLSAILTEARQNRADHVVTGRVARDGTVNVSIIAVQTADTVWTRSFQRRATESETAFTSRIERALRAALPDATPSRNPD